MTNKHADLSINLSIICLLAVASSLTGYQLWHRGAHGSEYLQNPTFWASAELPRIPAFHYGDGPFGTYVLVLGGACPSCTEEVDFCRRPAVAAKRTTKGTKLVVVYARGDRRIQGALKQNGLDVLDTVALDRVGPTPAMYFVDALGSVRGVWRGLLSITDQERILQAF
jgi:hypothetical protein